MDFKNSIVGQFIRAEQLSQPEIGNTSTPKDEALRIKLMEVRALVGRLGVLGQGVFDPELDQDIDYQLDVLSTPKIGDDLRGLLDEDIVLSLEMESNPSLARKMECKKIKERLRQLFQDPSVLKHYHEMYENIAKQKTNAEKLIRAYEEGIFNGRPLNDLEKMAFVRHVIRTMNEFLMAIDEEIQNIHNQVSVEKRDYLDTDKVTLEKLYEWQKIISEKKDSLIAQDYEVAIQVRMNHLMQNSNILKRIKPKKNRDSLVEVRESHYIETDSRKEMIYGTDGAENYILGCLRSGKNVELLGPTGTGKTQIAIHAAKVFSGKSPIVVSGGPGVYKSTFFGSPKGLDKRDPGAVIQCMLEDRILIIDEDNRVDPKQMAEIKLILGLKPGDTFYHPDTGEILTIPSHFKIIVTRNEAGKHHSDRHALPPDYRREFTHGSFEVDYYSPEEMYYEFLIPKLMNEDGSISLSEEEVGKDSPLTALVMAAKEIQEEYKSNKLKNAVFESGYLIEILDQWKEIRLSKKKKKVQFLDYLETKLLEFIKRPIGNSDRKIIVGKLCNQGFFRKFEREQFATASDGEVFSEAEFEAMTRGSTDVFRIPGGNEISSREVALLDPFKKYEITVPPHPLEKEISEFSRIYSAFCTNKALRKITFTAHTFDSKKEQIVGQMVDFAKSNNHKNLLAIEGIATLLLSSKESVSKNANLKYFLDKMTIILNSFNTI